MPARRTEQRMPVYLYAAFAAVITVAIIAFPSDSFNASKDGLRVWWEIVFPALLPFFVASEVLMGLGVVHMLGVLLEPLMRPLFRVPGVGAFAVAMGLASGYPIGAQITAKLRSERMCSRVEAERLVSISNTADPLFMAGAVAVGMLGQPRLGVILALSHYAASILLGFVMRFYGHDDRPAEPVRRPRSTGMVKRALEELVSAREADGRPIGQLLGDAVKDSVSTLLLIGGFIMVFSVITRIMSLVGIVHALAAPLALVLKPFKVEASLLNPLLEGLFEITIGCEEASRASASLYSKVIVCSAIIGWSGLSVHAGCEPHSQDRHPPARVYLFQSSARGAGGRDERSAAALRHHSCSCHAIAGRLRPLPVGLPVPALTGVERLAVLRSCCRYDRHSRARRSDQRTQDN